MRTGTSKLIMEATGCDENTAEQIEDIMRDVIFHSTLDWQTLEELQEAARLAKLVLEQMANE